MGSLFNSQNATIQSNSLSAFPTSFDLLFDAQTVTASVTIFPSTAVPTITGNLSWVYATYTAGSLRIFVDESVADFRTGAIILTHPDDETISVTITINQESAPQ